jgi:hypothetical protein
MVSPLNLPTPAAVGDEWGNALNAGVQAVNADVETLKGRLITAGTGLLGGGSLSANRSLSIDFAASGAASAGKAVEATDARLSDARTPLAHTHAYGTLTGIPATFAPAAHSHPLGDLPVAASGASDATKVVRSDDARLADARTPLAHTHDASTGLTGIIANAVLPTRVRQQAAYQAGGVSYNSMTDSGWYVMDSASANAPVAATCYLEVRQYTAAYIEQVARHVITGAEYRRYMNNGAWGAWLGSGSLVVETINLPGSSGYSNGSYARRRNGIVTVNVDAGRTAGSGTGAANSGITTQLPVGWRPAQTSYVIGMDSATGATAPVYINTSGFICSVFTRPEANGNLLATFTYVCDQA